MLDLIIDSNNIPDKDALYKRTCRKVLKSIRWHKCVKDFGLGEGADHCELLIVRTNVKNEREFRLLVSLSELLVLDLSRNHLSTFLSADLLAALPCLQQLILSHNRIEDIPAEALTVLSHSRRLEVLDLSNNKLKTLPPTIGLLTSLTSLRLESNQLIELPREIVALVLLTDCRTSFNIKGNKLITPNQKLAESGGWRTIRYSLGNILTSFEDEFWIKFNESYNRRRPDKKALKTHAQVKLHLLGSAGSGKTSLVAALLSIRPDSAEQDDGENNERPHSPGTGTEAAQTDPLVLSVKYWHPKIRRLDTFLKSQCLAAGQALSKDAPSIDGVAQGMAISAKVWDLSGACSTAYPIHRMLMTDLSIFLIVWDMRSDRFSEDVLRFIRFVLGSGVGNYKIIVCGSHADCLSDHAISAAVMGLKDFLRTRGYLEDIEQVVLPVSAVLDDHRLSFLAAQLAHTMVIHGQHHEKLRKVSHALSAQYSFVQDGNRRALFSMLNAGTDRRGEYERSATATAAAQALAQAQAQVAMGEGVLYRLQQQDVLIKAEWLVGCLSRLLVRQETGQPGQLNQQLIEARLSDADFFNTEHPRLLRYLACHLGLLHPLLDQGLTKGIASRSADDINLHQLPQPPKSSAKLRHVSDSEPLSDSWDSPSSTYLVPLLLPPYTAEDYGKPGQICLERKYLYAHPHALLTSEWFVNACLKGLAECQRLSIFMRWQAWDKRFLLEASEGMDMRVFISLEDAAEELVRLNKPRERAVKAVVRLRAYCHPLTAQHALIVLHKLSGVMYEQLACVDQPTVSKPTLSLASMSLVIGSHSQAHIQCFVTCPECLQSNRHSVLDSTCGQFSFEEIQLWEKEYHLQPGAAPDKSSAEYFYNLSKRRVLCPKRRCAVRPELLLKIPKAVLRCIEQSKQFTQGSRFLCDEVIRSGMQRVSSAAVKVMVATIVEDHLSALCGSSVDGKGTNRLTVTPQAVCSGVVCSIPIASDDSEASPKGNSHGTCCSNSLEGIFVITCEHAFTEPSLDSAQIYSYRDKYSQAGLALVFLVGDENHWLYMADLVYKGSAHPKRDRRFHDYAVLKLLCPIKAAEIKPFDPSALSFVDIDAFHTTHSVDLSKLVYETESVPEKQIVLPALSNPAVAVNKRAPLRRLRHPQYTSYTAPLSATALSTQSLFSDQYVYLLSYPHNKSLSVDFGHILQHDPKDEDILLEVLSDSGSSGGPLIDVYGRVVGVLSRSYNTIKYSYVQPIRELPAILSAHRYIFSAD